MNPNKIKKMNKEFIEMVPKDLNVSILGLQGSRALGLAMNNDADYDYRGVFIAPNKELLSFNKPKETISFGSSNDNEAEFVFHEVEKFFKLAIKGNPSILHLLFLPDYNYLDNFGQMIIANREIFLGQEAIRNAFGGYAYSQILYLKRNHKFSKGRSKEHKIKKHIRHCFRLFDSGIELLETGKITIPLKNPQKYLEIQEYNDEQKWMKLFWQADKKFKNTNSELPLRANKEMIEYLLLKIRGYYR